MMARSRLFLISIFSVLATALPAAGEDAKAPATTSAVTAETKPPETPVGGALRARIGQPALAGDEQAQKEAQAIEAFYAARNYAALWFDGQTATAKAEDLVKALRNADAYGLEAADFAIPNLAAGREASDAAAAEMTLTRSALLYARYARGGRIMKPAEQLNSNLDRKPQLLEPAEVLKGLAEATEPGAYLATLHPKHAQFEKLRQAYLKERGAVGGVIADAAKPLNASAKRLRANMEMWRWMYDDMGEFYVFNNIPEFMQRVYKNGEVIRSEKIVAGLIDKQSSVFSRPLKHVVLRPKWRVPDSIAVHEAWPSLLKGGGVMRQYGLEIETKDGRPVDWRRIDWSKDDIRKYNIMQSPGPKSVLGVVKFSFPSQHTIFMHDTPDKWMFKPAQRALSHGCLRVWKPVDLAELILEFDKGWDKKKVGELIRSGPLNNEVEIEKRVMINLVYFTAWIEDDGRVRAFADIYGHERRVAQALDKQWDKISKGRNHLAPPEPNFNPRAVAASPAGQAAQGKRKQAQSTGDLIGDIFGGLSF